MKRSINVNIGYSVHEKVSAIIKQALFREGEIDDLEIDG